MAARAAARCFRLASSCALLTGYTYEASTFVGMFVLAGWAVALASGQEAYEAYMGLLGSIPGKIVLFGFTVAVLYHLAAGLRHLFWDLGTGYKKEIATLTGLASFGVAIVGAVALWAVAGLIGAL